jgi:hypothetical protein
VIGIIGMTVPAPMAERHTRAPPGEEAMRSHFQLGYDTSTSSSNVNIAATP